MDSTTMITDADQITDDHDVYFFTDSPEGVLQGFVLATGLDEAAAKFRTLVGLEPEHVVGYDYHRYHLNEALELLAEMGYDPEYTKPLAEGNYTSEGEVIEAPKMEVEYEDDAAEPKLLEEMADTLTREIVLTDEDGEELYSEYHNVDYQHTDHYEGITRKKELPRIALDIISDEVDGEIYFTHAIVAGDVKDLGPVPAELDDEETVEFSCSDEIGSVEVHAKVLQ